MQKYNQRNAIFPIRYYIFYNLWGIASYLTVAYLSLVYMPKVFWFIQNKILNPVDIILSPNLLLFSAIPSIVSGYIIWYRVQETVFCLFPKYARFRKIRNYFNVIHPIVYSRDKSSWDEFLSRGDLDNAIFIENRFFRKATFLIVISLFIFSFLIFNSYIKINTKEIIWRNWGVTKINRYPWDEVDNIKVAFKSSVSPNGKINIKPQFQIVVDSSHLVDIWQNFGIGSPNVSQVKQILDWANQQNVPVKFESNLKDSDLQFLSPNIRQIILQVNTQFDS